MEPIRPADHAMGLELQLEELTEQRTRAMVQGRDDDAAHLRVDIESLQAELAQTAEAAMAEGPHADPVPELHYAEELNVHDELQ